HVACRQRRLAPIPSPSPSTSAATLPDPNGHSTSSLRPFSGLGANLLSAMPRPTTVSGGLNYHVTSSGSSSTNTSDVHLPRPGTVSPTPSADTALASGSATLSGGHSSSAGASRPSHRRSRSTGLAGLTTNVTAAASALVPQQLMSLSGVLNDPKSLKFAKLDLGGASVPVVPLKRVRMGDFEAYIKGIQGYYDQYAENRRAGLASATAGAPALKAASRSKYIDPREDPESPSASLYSLLGMDRIPGGSTSGGSRRQSILPPPSGHPGSSSSSSSSSDPQQPSGPPPLSSVPQVYFQPDFTLENPRIFDVITGSLDLHALEPALQALATHTDTVEDHLTREISTRSNSFFSALTNLTELHAETGQCLAQVETLRARLADLSRVHSKKALETVKLTQRRANVAKLLDALAGIHSVTDAAATVQGLLQQSDYVAALQVLAESAAAVQATRGIAACQVVHTRLADMGRTLGHLLVAELAQALVAQGVAAERLQEAKARITPLVQCLIRVDGLGVALAGYQDKLVGEVRGMIRKLYPPELLVETQPGQQLTATVPPFIKALKALTLERFLTLLDSVYREPDPHRCRQAPHGTLLPTPPVPGGGGLGDEDEFRSSAPDPHLPPPMDPASSSNTSGGVTYASLLLASARVVQGVTDFGHVRCAKLLTGRADQNAQLSLKDFVRLYSTAIDFVHTSDKLVADLRGVTGAATTGGGGGGPVALRSALQAQARAFVVHFHMERMKQLGMLVENEVWAQADVLSDFQAIVDRIADPAGTVDARRRRHLLATTASSGSINGGSLGDGLNKDEPPAAAPAPAKGGLATGSFPVANVVLMLGKMLDEYLQVVGAIPSLATDVHSKLVELLKTFNSRSCQMILGAGAVASAGLKSISAKHLAITSQSLGAVLALIPSIRTALADHMTEKQAVFLAEYGKITKDYADHQSEVYAKLVAIMEERVTFHSRSLGQVDWESQPVPMDETTLPPPTPAMEALVKETSTLHKVLARYLPSETLRMIMTRVFSAYNTHLERELARIVVTSVAAKNALLIDIQFFIRKLNALEGVDGPGSHLEAWGRGGSWWSRCTRVGFVDCEQSKWCNGRVEWSCRTSLAEFGHVGYRRVHSVVWRRVQRGESHGLDHKVFRVHLWCNNDNNNDCSSAGSSGMLPGGPSIGGGASGSGATLAGASSTAGAGASGGPPGAQAAASASAAAMSDAAQKTKQIASDWMKKMTFTMKSAGGQEH
ncbi:Vps54-like protein-domain-containing protein, partial [Catenaria anguillulae PL171]